MAQVEMTPKISYEAAIRQLQDLIELTESFPNTPKKRTTLRYLYASRTNLQFLHSNC